MKKIEINKIYNLNCIEGMKLIPKNKVDLVITDPPFAINFKAKKANYNRTSSRVIPGYNEIKSEDYYDFTFEWMSHVFRILKKSGSMYVFSGWNNLKDILCALDDVGFITVNHIIWKYQFGVVTKINLLLHIIIVSMYVKKTRIGNFFHSLDLPRTTKHKMEEVFIIKIKKMCGISKGNIGQEMKKLPPNFLLN